METTLLKEILVFLESSLRNHNYCEDGWYSCPKAQDGCYNDDIGTECNCGADKYNEEANKLISKIKSQQNPNNKYENSIRYKVLVADIVYLDGLVVKNRYVVEEYRPDNFFDLINTYEIISEDKENRILRLKTKNKL